MNKKDLKIPAPSLGKPVLGVIENNEELEETPVNLELRRSTTHLEHLEYVLEDVLELLEQIQGGEKGNRDFLNDIYTSPLSVARVDALTQKVKTALYIDERG